MLVKFLSYVASIIGARRYKPIFISLAVLTLTVTGLTMVVSALSSGSYDAASFEQNKTEPSQTDQPSSSDLKGLSRQQAKDESQQSIAKPESSTPTDTPKPGPAVDKQPAPAAAPDVTLSSSTLTVQSTGTAAVSAISASTAASLAWAVNGEALPVGLTITIDQKDPSNATVRFKTENAAPGNYQLAVTLKDGTTGLATQKTLQLIIVQ